MDDQNKSNDDSFEDEKIETDSFHKVVPSYISIRNRSLV